MHSVPHWPYINNVTNKVELDIADPQTMYGQNMLCIPIEPQTAFNLAGLMTMNKPAVYYTQIINNNANITLLVTNKTANYAFTQAAYNFT